MVPGGPSMLEISGLGPPILEGTTFYMTEPFLETSLTKLPPPMLYHYVPGMLVWESPHSPHIPGYDSSGWYPATAKCPKL